MSKCCGGENSDLVCRDISSELWREYDFGGRVYRIDFPVKLYFRSGGETHRVVDADGVIHCVPVPGVRGCVLRWLNKEDTPEVLF